VQLQGNNLRITKNLQKLRYLGTYEPLRKNYNTSPTGHHNYPLKHILRQNRYIYLLILFMQGFTIYKKVYGY